MAVMVFIILNTSYSQWTAQTAPPLPWYYSILSFHAVDENIVWAVADTIKPSESYIGSPYVLRTTDGGDSWNVRSIPQTDGTYLMDVAAVDANTAWVTMNGLSADSVGGIFKTTDGGETWTAQLDQVKSVYIHFFDMDNGVQVNRHRIHITTNSGNTWELIPPENIPSFGDEESTIYYCANNAVAVSGDRIWMGTSYGRILRSTDKGLHWDITAIAGTFNLAILSVSFRDTLHGIATACYNGKTFQPVRTKMARTSDGGETWEMISNPPSTTAGESITYVPGTEHTYVVNSHYHLAGTAISMDDGVSWTTVDDKGCYGLAFVSPTKGWSSLITTPENTANYILRWSGNSLPVEEMSSSGTASSFALEECYPNPVVSSATISFHLPSAGLTRLTVHDVLGRCVKVLAEEFRHAGAHKVTFNESHLPSGVYVYRLAWNGQVMTRRMTLLK